MRYKNMSIKELLKKIQITDIGYYENNAYIIDIADNQKFGRYFSLLETAENDGIIDSEDTSTEVSLDKVSFVYYAEDYIIKLEGNLSTDEYKLICYEN